MWFASKVSRWQNYCWRRNSPELSEKAFRGTLFWRFFSRRSALHFFFENGSVLISNPATRCGMRITRAVVRQRSASRSPQGGPGSGLRTDCYPAKKSSGILWYAFRRRRLRKKIIRFFRCFSKSLKKKQTVPGLVCREIEKTVSHARVIVVSVGGTIDPDTTGRSRTSGRLEISLFTSLKRTLYIIRRILVQILICGRSHLYPWNGLFWIRGCLTCVTSLVAPLRQILFDNNIRIWIFY